MLKVKVLMSTYNGEKYIKEQIESVLNQEGVEVSLLIRDDGSKDSTRAIVKEYAENNQNVEMYTGDNLGPALSFLDLCKHIDSADYYAFCDQDDIWDQDKLLVAVNMLEKQNGQYPNMYFSNLRLVDAEGNFFRDSYVKPVNQKNRYVAYLWNIATGCTIVFNNACLELVNREKPTHIYMHDYWVYLICKMFGKTIYDHTPHISYRQHGNNVCGMMLASKGIDLRIVAKKAISYLCEERNEALLLALNNFYACYKNELCDKDRKKLLKVICYRASLKNRIKLLFDIEIHHYNLKTDIRYRRRIIQGKLQM